LDCPTPLQCIEKHECFFSEVSKKKKKIQVGFFDKFVIKIHVRFQDEMGQYADNDPAAYEAKS
jgi:hypothetical protein